MSGDWTQRLPTDIRKYKEQILAKLHIAHHQHKRSQTMAHRLKILERFQWFLFWFIFGCSLLIIKFAEYEVAFSLYKLKWSFPTLVSFSYLLGVSRMAIVMNVIAIMMRFFGGALKFFFVLMVSLLFFLLVLFFKWREESMREIFELIFEL